MIYGIQKLSLIDYPSFPCFVIFLGGCNFRCPFCHNESIVNKKENIYETEEVIKEIQKRTSFINAVVITGGEPTIYGSKLIELMEKIQKLHLKIKLDTNGTNPILLKKIIDLKLVDYIAMDIKNTWEKYSTNDDKKNHSHQRVYPISKNIHQRTKSFFPSTLQISANTNSKSKLRRMVKIRNQRTRTSFSSKSLVLFFITKL